MLFCSFFCIEMSFLKVVANKNAINIFNLHGKKTKTSKWQNSIKKPENCGATCFPNTQITYLLCMVHRLLVWGTLCRNISFQRETKMFADKYVLLPIGNAIKTHKKKIANVGKRICCWKEKLPLPKPQLKLPCATYWPLMKRNGIIAVEESSKWAYYLHSS